MEDAAQTTSGWQAFLHLAFAPGAGRTVLAENRHRGPLMVQRPLYPEKEVCHVCLLHPPGGVVGGDALNLQLAVQPGARALVTTPGATKFYRSGGRFASQQNALRVEGGVLEWLPQDNIVFRGADAGISTTVELDATAGFIGWEIMSLGLPTQGQRFDDGSLASGFALSRAGRPLLCDRLAISCAADLDSVIGLRGYPVTGLFVAAGCEEHMVEPLRQLVPQTGRCLTGVTLMGELLLARYLGDSTFEAREIFQKLWSWLRPVLYGLPACPPRIWAT